MPIRKLSFVAQALRHDFFALMYVHTALTIWPGSGTHEIRLVSTYLQETWESMTWGGGDSDKRRTPRVKQSGANAFSAVY